MRGRVSPSLQPEQRRTFAPGTVVAVGAIVEVNGPVCGRRREIMSEARVDILDAATGEVVDRCYGPTLGGACPRADRVGVVLCQGRRIVPLSRGPECWLLRVPPASRRCPLEWNGDAAGN
jgi:hypothetical protein